MTHLKELLQNLTTLIADRHVIIEQPRPGECESVTQERLDACTAERARQLAAARAQGWNLREEDI